MFFSEPKDFEDFIEKPNIIIYNWELTPFYGKNLIFKGSVFNESINFITSKKYKTSANRYTFRKEKWFNYISAKYELKNLKLTKLIAFFSHKCWWLIHNCIAHPFLAFNCHIHKLRNNRIHQILVKNAVYFHDFTSEKLNLEYSKSFVIPLPPSKKWWVIHNLIVHPLIGLFPCKITFKWHDLSALKMKTMGWI